MSADFFRVYRGLELNEAAQFLTGAGVPGAAGDTSLAPRGSYFTDTDTGSLWVKTAQGAGAEKWSKLATEDFVASTTSTGVSWREPVAVVDDTSTTVADIKADLDADDLIQGVAVVDGMRILGASVTGNANVFLVSGTSGNWTLTEDSNSETVGDATYVIGGDDAGKTFQYNGTAWVWINSSDQTELNFLRAYVGKDGAGAELPSYTSVNIVANNDTLETAIGKLDAEAGYTDTFVGKTAGNTTPTYSSTNFVTNGEALTLAVGDLDAAIGAPSANGFVTTNAASVNANVDALDNELESASLYVGKTAGDSTPDYSSTNYVADNDNLTVAVGKLDAALAASGLVTTLTNVTSISAVDTVTAGAAEWDVFVREIATPTRVRAFKVFAMHNGTNVDSTIFATLARGGSISGFQATVTLVGGALVLNVQSTSAVDVRAQRLSVLQGF